MSLRILAIVMKTNHALKSSLLDQYPVVSPSRFWPLVEIHEEIRAHGFCAELAQQSGYLAPMVARMVDYVDQLLPEQIGIALTLLVDVSLLFT
jgi:hypothetical protein